MRIKYLLGCAFLWLAQPVFSQKINLSEFDYLKCYDAIPSQLTMLSAEKFKEQLDRAKQEKTNGYVDKYTEEFLLLSNYTLDELLLSGKILFNEPLSNYITKVAGYVLKNDQALLHQLSFFVVRTNDQNAFATHQGMIFITVGLLAELENEAELAFVLSHEIAHYERKHIISGYVEGQKVLNDNGKNRYNSTDEKIHHISNYSKELELEADSLGFIRFSKLGYDPGAATAVMDVLQFSELPFYEMPFDMDYFKTDSFAIPKPYILDSVKAIDYTKHKMDDEYSTHPNLHKRSVRLTHFQNELLEYDTKKYMTDVEEFTYVRALSRLEAVRLLLLDRQYPEAVFEATTLLKHEFGGKNQFLEKSIAKGLYGITKYKLHGNYGDCGERYNSIEGEMQRSFYLFYKLENEEIALLTARKLYDYCANYPADKFMAELRNDLFEDVINTWDVSQAGISKQINAIKSNRKEEEDKLKKSFESVETVKDTTRLTKMELLRKQREEEEKRKKSEVKLTRVEEKTFYLAFDGIAEKPEFISLINTCRENIEFKKTVASEAKKEKQPLIRAGKSNQKKHREKLPENLHKIVFVDPFFVSLDRNEEIQWVESEKKLIKLEEILRYSCNKTGMGYDVIAPKTFSGRDIDRYNHLARLNDWMDEALDHDNVPIIPLQAENVKDLANVYGTTHFAYTGVLHFIQPKENVGSMLLYGVLFYPVMPYVLAKVLTPSQRTLFYTMIINLETGKAEYNEASYIEASDNLHMVSSIVYDRINQMTFRK